MSTHTFIPTGNIIPLLNPTYLRHTYSPLIFLILYTILYMADAGCTNGAGNCKTCANALFCQICASGYGNVLGVCGACAVGNCDDCNANVVSCFKCKPGTGVNSGPPVSCSPCLSANCADCTSNKNICIACTVVSKIGLSGSSCVACTNQYC